MTAETGSNTDKPDGMISNLGQTTDSLQDERDAIVKTLPTRSDIYLPTNKIDLEAQIVGLRYVREIYDDMERVYGPKLRALKDKYRGHDRAFIIGNGPSLNETDLSCLRDEVTFCVNGFFLKTDEIDWTPTFYVVEDHLVAEDRADAINQFKGPTKLFPAYLGYCLDRGDDTIFYNHRPRVSYPDGFDFSTDAAKITYTGCTVTFSCMQLAHYMGFRELYLIGVDASYDIPDDAEESEDYGTGVIDMKSDDTNHFHPDYFGKGYRWHDPQVGKMIEAYQEAEQVTRALDRPIYNATVGGQLEVFERRSYHDLFPDAIAPDAFQGIGDDLTPKARTKAVQALVKEKTRKVPNSAHSPHPKVCIIDMTRIGGATATGELKATLFGPYPPARLMQVFAAGKTVRVQSTFVPGADGMKPLNDLNRVLDYILDFEPDVIVFRPTPEAEILNQVAELAFTHCSARFVTWIMDGWQDRLLATDPPVGQRAEAFLQRWFDRSAHCLAISDLMAEAYKNRYGQAFTPIANAVDPKDWDQPNIVADEGATLTVRYSGGLAPDMSLATLENIAKAVEVLSDTYAVRFEINTRQHWIHQHGDVFEAFRTTHVTSDKMDVGQYRKWISDGDISVIAYNFDDSTRTYVRHSMANKLPECLASGSPLLAVGPKELATIDYLDRHDVGQRVTEPGLEAVKQGLEPLLKSKAARQRLSKRGRQFVFENRSLAATQDSLYDILRSVARMPERTALPKVSERRTTFLASLSKREAPLIKQERSNSVAQALRTQPHYMGKVSFRDVVGFFSGAKGLMAFVIILLAALPAIPLSGWMAAIAKFGPAVSFIGFFFLLGRWLVQLTFAVQSRHE